MKKLKGTEMQDDLKRAIQLQRTEIKPDEYMERMKVEFDSMEHFLPKADKEIKILDIGCGAGGLDVYLIEHYASQGILVKIDLLDKDGFDENIHYGYEETASNYNIMENTLDFMCSHIKSTGIHLSGHQEFPYDNGPWDLIVSTLAWGFHFPLNEYWDVVDKNLENTLIVDVRKNTKDHDNMNKMKCDIVLDTLKFTRFAYVK